MPDVSPDLVLRRHVREQGVENAVGHGSNDQSCALENKPQLLLRAQKDEHRQEDDRT